MNAKEVNEWFESRPEDVGLASCFLGAACIAAVAADKAAAHIVECNAHQDNPRSAAHMTQAHLHYGATTIRFTTKMWDAHNAVYDIERHHQSNLGPVRDVYNEAAWGLHAKWKHHVTTAIQIFKRRRIQPPGLIINERAAFLAIANAFAIAGEHHEEPNADDIKEHKEENDSEPPRPVTIDSEDEAENKDEAHLQNEHLMITGRASGQAMHLEAPPTVRRPNNTDTPDEATDFQETAGTEPHNPAD